MKGTDRFTCTSANVISCMPCTLCKEFFLKIVVTVVQSGLKPYDLTVMAAGVQMNEFEIAPFAQR